MTPAAGLLLLALAAPSDDVERAIERVRTSGEYQTELPGARPPVDPPPARPRRSDVGTREPRPIDDGGGRNVDLGPIGLALLWLVVGAMGVAFAVWLVREWRARSLARKATVALAAAPAAEAAPAEAPLLDHERLARDGEFAEAIHAILVFVLVAIGRAHAGMRPAWTSREILVQVKLEEGAQRALASLVRQVEVTRFGGAAAGEEEYRRALGWLEAIGRRRAA